MRCDVLVIGAGPAGSAAALTLARAGLDVLLADRREFPRDKTCGDALLPDATSALARMGLLDDVLADAIALETLRVHAPGGGYVDLHGRFAALTRRVLDDRLRDAAVRDGARFEAPLAASAPILDGDRIAGARMEDGKGRAVEVAAKFTVLATGAAGPLRPFAVPGPTHPDAYAARAYFEAPPEAARAHRRLAIAYERTICPAYGWIFALPGGLFNVGAGWIRRPGRRTKPPHLRKLFDDFVASFAPARDLVRESRRISPLIGAPLRTSFGVSGLGRPGLLVAGEAAGLTYPFTGEGIGKAMESGILAAETLVSAFRSGAEGSPDALAAYSLAARRAFHARFETYRRAQTWVSVPWLCDFLCARARDGSYVRRQIEGMIAETANPRALFSPWGFARALLG